MSLMSVDYCESIEKIEQLKLVELEVLSNFHEFCIKHHLTYSLFYGSLLGAVRHKGFIPWDDDLDVIMPRDDYDKLIEIWKSDAPNGYVLQDYHQEKDTFNNFLQIKKDNTTLISYEMEFHTKTHKGIKLDIFPMDRVAPTRFGKKIQYFSACLNLLYSRGHINQNSSRLSRLIQKVLLFGNQTFYFSRIAFTESIMKKWNKSTTADLVCFDIIEDCKKYFPSDMFDQMELADFENRKFFIPSKYHEILTSQYGDYNQYPPIEERVYKHHPILIDFAKNYQADPSDN